MIRKLSLDVDTLSVSSFATAAPAAGRGTVMANVKSPACPWSQPLSCAATVHTCASFDVSCRVEG
jgi:hypothetical protein